MVTSLTTLAMLVRCCGLSLRFVQTWQRWECRSKQEDGKRRWQVTHSCRDWQRGHSGIGDNTPQFVQHWLYNNRYCRTARLGRRHTAVHLQHIRSHLSNATSKQSTEYKDNADTSVLFFCDDPCNNNWEIYWIKWDNMLTRLWYAVIVCYFCQYSFQLVQFLCQIWSTSYLQTKIPMNVTSVMITWKPVL